MTSYGKQRQWRLLRVILAMAVGSIDLGAAVILVYNEGTTRFDDVPSMDNFGPRIPEEGFAGRLQLAQPNVYACSAISGPTSTTAVASATAVKEAAGELDFGGAAPPSRTRAHSGVSRGMPLAVSRQPPRGEILEAVTTTAPATATATATATAAAGEEDLPSAALISRSEKDDPSGCTFETKVLNAQAAGFSMVIVYDSREENLFKMGRSSSKGAKHPKVEIPLVLVTHASGLALKALIETTSDTRGPEVYVDNTDPFGMFVTVDLTMFMLVTGFLLALLTCGSMMVVTLHRYLRRYESLVAGTNRPMSLPEVLQLPEVRVEEGSRLEGDACPVCLEAYRIGDKLRSLPCQHAFHAGCITPWLTQRQRSCPMCKDPVTLTVGLAPPTSSSPSSSSASSAAPAAVITAPAIQAAHADGGERGDDGAGGDRLPLLSNSRGAPIGGGSIQDTSPV
ncbi:unnamed protein product [Ectocarpus sp. 12 AP-2014]